MKKLYALVAVIVVAIVLTGLAIHVHDKVTCHWEVPLKTNYEMCSNGKTIEK